MAKEVMSIVYLYSKKWKTKKNMWWQNLIAMDFWWKRECAILFGERLQT